MIEVERKKSRDVNVGEWRERDVEREWKNWREKKRDVEREKQIYELVQEKESRMRMNELEKKKKEMLRERKKGEIERTKIWTRSIYKKSV